MKKIFYVLIAFVLLIAGIFGRHCRIVSAEENVAEQNAGVGEEIFSSSIVCCGEQTAIIKEDGSLWMCGWNYYGQIGDGTSRNIRIAPVKVMDDVKYVDVDFHTAIIKEDGSLWMSGRNDDGQLGDGTNCGRNTPVKVMDGVKYVSCGNAHTAILKEDGSLWTCGSNKFGQLGDGTNDSGRNTPLKVMNNVKYVTCGTCHTAVIKEDGSLWMCGLNTYGQLGDGTGESKYNFVKVMDSVWYVSCDGYDTAIIKEDGSLWTCGDNYYGQFGDGTSKNKRYTPIKVMDDVKYVDVDSHTAIIKEDGSLWVCGHNQFGQLGDGTTEHNYLWNKIMENVCEVSCGTGHTVIKKTDGSIWVCGWNERGQLGDGTQRSTSVFINPSDFFHVGVASQNIYTNSSLNASPSASDVTLFSNGKKGKNISGERVSYQEKIFYTSVTPGSITYEASGKTKTVTGKLVVGITMSSTKPKCTRGRIIDAAAAKIATAKYNKRTGKITVKAKPNAKGNVYLWVVGVAIARGNTVENTTVGFVKLNIKTAPTTINIYRAPATTVNKTVTVSGSSMSMKEARKQFCKNGEVNVSCTERVYIDPIARTNRIWSTTNDAQYTVEINSSAKEYFDVGFDDENPNCIEITVKKLGENGKKVKGTVTVTCIQNGKKKSFAVNAVNRVEIINVMHPTALSLVTGAGICDTVTMSSLQTLNTSGTFELNIKNRHNELPFTDTPRLYMLNSEDGFVIHNGRIRITDRAKDDTTKMKARLSSDKKIVTITIAKQTPNHTTGYLLIVYNTNRTDDTCGYRIIKIIVDSVEPVV